MRHWWTLLGEDDHASIVGVFGKFASLMRLRVDHGLLEALASFWDPTHCCFSVGEVDLIPTLEESSERKRLRRKANIPLDLLTKYFSWSDFPVELARGLHCKKEMDGRNSESTPSRSPLQGRSIIPAILCETVRSLSYCRRRGEGVPMFCTQLLQLWFCSHLQYFYRLQTPYHFERHTVRQTVNTALPFTGNSRDWALYLLDLPLSEWSWKVTWGPAVWIPWTHCALFDGVPLPGVWGCTGYYPSLALRQFGGVQYPPRLGDLSAVTFDYVPGEDMWRLLFRVEDIWGGRLSEMVLIEGGLHADSSVTPDFVEWREGWSPSFTLRPTIRPCASCSLVSCSLRASAFTGQSERVAVLERELEEARAELSSLRLARASEREESATRVESMRSTLHHSNAAVANLRRDLEAAKDHLEQTLAETQGQLETEQVERTRVQDELDSLRSYTQALVDPSTGHPHDIVALRRALDESEAALTLKWTWCMMLFESNASWLNREGFPVVTALHQVNQVMDSLGARARAVLEEHDEGDPALSTALGRFCRETCIRLGH
uniref:DUF7745 domain-containing protein n=1 Tax=Fagus sylvatica TaxID=28930 RepID=A0A2N9I9N2_FAGSY